MVSPSKEQSTTGCASSDTKAGIKDMESFKSCIDTRREKACGMIICALGDAPLRVIMDVDDDPAQMLKPLDNWYASSRAVSRIAVQTQLFWMSYNHQNMS